MATGATGLSDFKQECQTAMDAFGLAIDETGGEPLVVLKQDDDSKVLRIRCLDQGVSKFFVAKYRTAEDKLVPFSLTAKIEKLVRNEHALLAWSDDKELQSLIPKRRRGKDGQTIWRDAAATAEGAGCWCVSEYIDNAVAFDWLTSVPEWRAEHARAAGELLAMLHCAGRAAIERLTGAEAHQLSSVLPTLPDLLSEAIQLSKESTAAHNTTATTEAGTTDAGTTEVKAGYQPLKLSSEESAAIVDRLKLAVKELNSGANAAALAADQVIVHGDFHPGNILFSGVKAVAAIDLDYAHLEHPLYDLAYAILMFTPTSATTDCARNLIDGYLNHYQRVALEPPSFFKSEAALEALDGKNFDAKSPLHQYFVVAACLILLWTLSPTFGRRQGARSVADRMAKLLSRS